MTLPSDIALLQSQLEKQKSLIESQSRQRLELISELTQTRAELQATCDTYQKRLDLTTSAHCVALKSLVKTLDCQYLTIEKDLSAIQRWLNQTQIYSVSDGLIEYMDLKVRSGAEMWDKDSDWDSDVNDCVPGWFITGEQCVVDQAVDLDDEQEYTMDEDIVQMVELTTEVVSTHPLLHEPDLVPKSPSSTHSSQPISSHSPPNTGLLDIPQPKLNEIFCPIEKSLNSVLQTPIANNSIPTPPTGWFSPLKAFVDSFGDALNPKPEPHLRVANPDQPKAAKDAVQDKVGVWRLGVGDDVRVHWRISADGKKRRKRESITQEIARFAVGLEKAMEEVLEVPFKWFE